VAPHAAELRALAGDRLTVVPDRKAMRTLLAGVLAAAPWNSHVYTCGPPGLIAEVSAGARGAHWEDARVHAEPFVAAPGPGTPFTAVLRRSGREVAVGADESLLDALDRAGVAAPRRCRQGVCGECVTPVTAGRVEHRDTVLDDERDGRMALCVSRAAVGETLELDL
jgi:ferredoxin